jgi:hypothetical protein
LQHSFTICNYVLSKFVESKTAASEFYGIFWFCHGGKYYSISHCQFFYFPLAFCRGFSWKLIIKWILRFVGTTDLVIVETIHLIKSVLLAFWCLACQISDKIINYKFLIDLSNIVCSELLKINLKKYSKMDFSLNKRLSTTAV